LGKSSAILIALIGYILQALWGIWTFLYSRCTFIQIPTPMHFGLASLGACLFQWPLFIL
jgi:hypothetical protein